MFGEEVCCSDWDSEQWKRSLLRGLHGKTRKAVFPLLRKGARMRRRKWREDTTDHHDRCIDQMINA